MIKHKVTLFQVSCNNVFQILYLCRGAIWVNPKKMTFDNKNVTCKKCLKLIKKKGCEKVVEK